jgi:hypothetical protein
MTSFQPPRKSRYLKGANSRAVAVTLGALLSAAPAGAQTTTQQPVKKPLVPVPQKAGAQPQVNNVFSMFSNGGNSGQRTAPALSSSAQKFLNPNGNAAAGNNAAAKNPLSNLMNRNNATTGANRQPASAVNNRPTVTGPQVPAKSFPGYPAPVGGKEMQGRNGSIIRTASDGSVMDVRNPSKGMVIHHSIDGSRRVMVQSPNGSRAYIPARGIPYVQHPYTFHGQQMDSRTFVVGGQLFHQVYRPYKYAGQNLDVYATSRYYTPKFYNWVASRGTPKPFTWPYNASTPWYGHYQGYFTPDSSYSSPSQWLTDFMLAATLYVAYQTKQQASDAPPQTAAPVTPQVKQKLNDEIQRQVKQESSEAADNAQSKDLQPGAGSVVQDLSDHQTHAFLVSSDLDLTDPSGRRCTLSDGDSVDLVSAPNSDSGTVNAVVLSSKGGTECGAATQVQIALNDAQEMQNHMRALIDQGMATAPAQTQGPTQTPAFAAAAPPADQNATQEIEQQTEIAAAADG